MPALKCSVGIQRKSGSGFQPLRRAKMPRPLFEAEPRNLADIVSRELRMVCGLFADWLSRPFPKHEPWAMSDCENFSQDTQNVRKTLPLIQDLLYQSTYAFGISYAPILV